MFLQSAAQRPIYREVLPSGGNMLILRRISALILALAAIGIWFGLRPESTSSTNTDFSSDITSALSEYSTNNSSASYAPQQQVVNGWAAKDLLTVIAKEQNAALSPKTAPSDDRIPALLVLGVLGIAMLGATAERRKPGPGAAPTYRVPAGPLPGGLSATPGPQMTAGQWLQAPPAGVAPTTPAVQPPLSVPPPSIAGR
jgi:hypothetical protein